MFYFIVAVIIAWLLFRVFSTNVSDDKVETVILVCAIIVLFYHFLLKHILDTLDSSGKYMKEKIKGLNL